MRQIEVPTRYKFENLAVKDYGREIGDKIRVEQNTVTMTEGHYLLCVEHLQIQPEFKPAVLLTEDLSFFRKKAKKADTMLIDEILPDNPGDDVKYPKWESVIPDYKDATFKVRFNVAQLTKMLKAIDSDEVEFYFENEKKAVLLNPADYYENRCFGLIMPRRLSDDIVGSFLKDWTDSRTPVINEIKPGELKVEEIDGAGNQRIEGFEEVKPILSRRASNG